MNEGTPSTLQTLVRKGELSGEEWNLILEHLRLRIKPFLDTITLPTVGDLLLNGTKRDSGRRTHTVDDDLLGDAMDGGPDHLSDEAQRTLEALGTQGLFSLRGTTESADGTFYRGIWGLSRSGEWMGGKLMVDSNHSSATLYQKALKIILQPSSPDELLMYFGLARGEYYYRQWWKATVAAFGEIVEEREKKYKQVRLLQKDFELEGVVLESVLCRRP